MRARRALADERAAFGTMLSLRLRIWERVAAWRVGEQLRAERCRHDGRAPLCWSCAIGCCRVR